MPVEPAASSLDAIVARLRRTTASTRYIAEIDGLRFLAIAMVVSFHLLATYRLGTGQAHMAPPPFGNALTDAASAGLASRVVVGFGYGVEIFFGISGFILALPFIAHRFADGPARPIRAYYVRRVTRLEPPYLVALMIASILALTLGTAPSIVAPRFLVSAIYANGTLYGHASPISSVLWSLEIEVFFYATAPALALLFGVFAEAWMRRIMIGLVAVAGVLIAPVLGTFLFRGPAEFLLYLPFFLAGWLIADLSVLAWRTPSPHPRLWDIAAAAGLAGCLVVFTQPLFLVVLAGPFVVWLLIAGVLRGAAAKAIFRNRVLATIGGMCYSIYLMHYPTMVMIAPIFGRSSGWLITGALLVADALVVGAVCLTFYLLVERPCMDPTWPARFTNWFARFTRRAVPVVAPAGIEV